MPQDEQVVVVDPSSDAARSAMQSYFDELAERFPEGWDAPDALDAAASAFAPPRGVFLLAYAGDEVVACGGAQWLDHVTGEVKRMWVSPSYRGRGMARRLLAHLESQVAASGRSRVVLDTNRVLTEAVALYTSSGYVPVPAYNDNPYAHHWFAKDLRP